MKRNIFLLVAVSLLVASPALAIDGNTLLKNCNEAIALIDKSEGDHNMLDGASCISYIESTTDLYNILVEGKSVKKLYCFPEKYNI